jgi:hypothetical protein
MTSMPLKIRNDTIRQSRPQEPAPEELLLPPQPDVEDIWEDVKDRTLRAR